MADDHSNVNLAEIYNRLHGTENYHPFSADTFGDWAVEGGDLITIEKEGKSYKVPVNEETVVWRGKTQTQISATGNKERDTISKMTKQKYGGGYGGVGAAERLYTFEVNQDHLLYDVYDEYGMLHGCLEMTNSKLRVAFSDMYNGLESRIEMTASHLQVEFWGLYDGLGSRLELTRSHLQVEFWGLYDGLSSTLELTRSHLQVDFYGLYDGLSSTLELTRSRMQVEFWGLYDGLGSRLELTRSRLVVQFTGMYDGLESELVVTRSVFYVRIADTYNGLSSYIEQTKSSIIQTVTARYDGLKSFVIQTASSITTVVQNNYSQLESRITQTASSITQTVNNNYNGLSSKIDQTASGIQVSVGNVASRVDTIEGSSLWVNRDNVTTVVGQYSITKEWARNADGTWKYDEQGNHVLEDTITVKNGTNFRIYKDGVVSDVVSQNRVVSSINQNSEGVTIAGNRINIGGVVDGINRTEVTIAASKINLSGYVTASQLSAVEAKFDNLFSGNSQITKLKSTNNEFGRVTISGEFYFHSNHITLKDVTIGDKSYHLLGYGG